MLLDPAFKPKLRPLEAFRLSTEQGESIGLRDPGGLSDVVLTMSVPAFQLLSLMDGVSTCDEIRRRFLNEYAQSVAAETLRSTLEYLERSHFLEGQAFESHYRSLVEQYRSRGVREMQQAEALGVLDDSGDVFEKMLAGARAHSRTGPVRGLVVPHLDYRRGAPCYADAYASLRDRPPPHRIVILGTNHFGRAPSVTATASDFRTPLGTSRTDRRFLQRLADRCGDLCRWELDHQREHSVELQVAWVQHLFGAREIQIVPVLCPDACGAAGTAPVEGAGVDLGDFATALSELIQLDPLETLLIAGADLSHVGNAFGDDRALNEHFLAEVAGKDRQALARLEARDPEQFLCCVSKRNNDTRICSTGCLYAMAATLRDARVEVVRYHQAVDQPSQTCVTCAAAVYS